MKINVPKHIMNVIEKMNEVPNTTTLIVGGAIRDSLLGNIPNDWDISTNVPMEILEDMFETHDIGKNREFGIVCIKVDGEQIEITQLRDESVMKDRNDLDGLKFL